jgi:hypothetical protein
MRRTLMVMGLVAAVAAPSIASAESCQSYAHDRRVTGTVLGGVGGALLGGAISHNGTGALLGGLGGAVVGNQVARVNCPDAARYSSSASYHSRPHPAPKRAAAAPAYDHASYASTGGCHYENRPYYDERGQMVYAPTQVCR